MGKIDNAGLKAMAINLLRDGMTEKEIAEALNKHCAEKDLRDPRGSVWQFSQPTVNRELKEYRRKYKAEAQTKLNKLVNDHIESDFAVIQESQRYMIGVARDENQTHAVRSKAYIDVCNITFNKWKTSLHGGDETDEAELIAKAVREAIDPELRKKIDAITQGSSPQGIQRTH